LKAVQSAQIFASTDVIQLVLAITLWTMVIGCAVSVALLTGQRFYMRRRWLHPLDTAKALGGGLLAGAIGGCFGQVLFHLTSGWKAPSYLVGWTLLGGMIGAGLAPFVPNLKWYRGLLGGLVGGLLGAAAFVWVTTVADELLGRWLGAAILGFCIGVMVALAELAFRRWWLEVRFGPREVRTFTLGLTQINIGSDERRTTVVVPGSAPIALRYWVQADHVFCEDRMAGEATEALAGDCRSVGKVTVMVCSSATARSSGYILRLSTGKELVLGEGMPMTAEDLAGLEPQGADGIVALASRRPSEPRVLILRNRSRQIWAAREASGATRMVEPGLGIELGNGLKINFGNVQGEFVIDRNQRVTGPQRINR
jgi:hypothetical protein